MVIEIDGRPLQPPEPFERVVAALEESGPGDQVILLLNREPRPLFNFLERNGYRYEVEYGADGTVRTTISVG